MSDPDHQSRIRLLIDANVLISHLLTGNPQSTIGRFLRISFEYRFEQIVPKDLLDELLDARRKPYLADKLSQQHIERLVSDLQFIGTVVDPAPRKTHSRILRDRGDDYLLTTAVVHDVDIIVSGDRHVLEVGRHLDRPRIMTPADFVAEFGQE